MWEAEYKGARKTLAEWGIKDLGFSFLSMDVDTVTFEVPGEIDTTPAFAYGETIKIFHTPEAGGEAVQWFVGRVDQTPQSASGRHETDAYVLVGPWWHLVDIKFQKSWKEYINPLDTALGLTTKFRSHYILNLSVSGAYQNTTEQIREALQWCLDCAAAKGRPAPFQIGTIDLPLAQPYTFEVLDQSCAWIIHRQAQWTPSAVGWFDYATSPPTFHLKQRAALRKVMLPVSDCEEVQLAPRYDLQVGSVVIKYEAVDVVNGVAYPRLHIDAAPADADGREEKAVLSTVNLEGAAVSYSLSEIVCQTIDTASVEWWKAQHAPLNHETKKNITITGVARSTPPGLAAPLPRELLAGAVTGWLLQTQGAAVARETITALASYDIVDKDDPDKVLETRKEEPISTEIETTNLVSGTYKSSLDFVLAEPVPTGLANFIYQAASALHYDGVVTLSEEEVSGRVGLGDLLNISAARAEYAAMDAQVQGVSGTVAVGKTFITVGPPKHLDKDDILQFLQANRDRVRFTSAAAVTGGVSVTAAPVEVGKKTPVKNSNASGAQIEKFTVAQHIVVDKADNPDKRAVKLRELDYCLDGVPKKIMVLASEPY